MSPMSPSDRPEQSLSCINHMHNHMYTASYKYKASEDASVGLQTVPTKLSLESWMF